ncbi:unnamed protein product [Oikopleura dioica]|uniref:Uncharacterized protein n=1 Tax=Oikopleura dioica TaxID=34765 RepID=E4WQM3_OIKDI|nr:unnamed protein product [Oikopleura dioica]CBY36867.1 unnamed protein product [Oikopleura dioica]
MTGHLDIDDVVPLSSRKSSHCLRRPSNRTGEKSDDESPPERRSTVRQTVGEGARPSLQRRRMTIMSPNRASQGNRTSHGRSSIAGPVVNVVRAGSNVEPSLDSHKEESEETPENGSSSEEDEYGANDMDKIFSIQFMVSFDDVFSEFSLKHSTISSIEIMKKEIEDKFESKRASYSDIVLQIDPEIVAKKKSMLRLRREQLIKDVWDKQHPFRSQFARLREESLEKWRYEAQKALDDVEATRALQKIQKYLYYDSTDSSMMILKSMAFQMLNNNRVSSIAINRANELGVTEEQEKALTLSLAECEFKQAEKYVEEGNYSEAVQHYRKVHEIIPDFEDCLTCIVFLELDRGNTNAAMDLLLQQIQRHPGRMDLRILRTRQYLLNNRLVLCHEHLDALLATIPDHPEVIKMHEELESRGAKAENNCIIYFAAGHLKDALVYIGEAIAARPKLLRLYLLRAKIYRRLSCWTRSLEDLELIYKAEAVSLKREADSLIFCILNDAGVSACAAGNYDQAVRLFTAVLKYIKGERRVWVNRADCWFRLGEPMLAIQDYSEALNLADDEPICRIIRGRISVVYYELGTECFDQNNYGEADHHYSLAIEYHIHITYLIQRSKARILLGNEKGAKLDAIAAYKVDPYNRELIPLLARLFPTTGLPEVEDHLMRHFPLRETTLRAIKSHKKPSRTKICVEDFRKRIVSSTVKPLPPIRSQLSVTKELVKVADERNIKIKL